jgi:hypothetical protein
MNESCELDATLGDLADHPSRGSRAIDKAVMVSLAARGLNQAQIAEFFGVSGAAVSKMRKRLEVAISRDVTTGQAATQLVEANLLSGARLTALAQECEGLIRLCSVVVHAKNEFAPEVQDAKNKLRRLVGVKGSLGQMAVSLMGEARKQLEFAFKIQSETYNLRRVEEFQAVVLEEIKGAAPEVQQRIMARLQQVQAFRASTDIPGSGGSLTF